MDTYMWLYVVGGGLLLSWVATQYLPIKLTCVITKGIHMTIENINVVLVAYVAGILYSPL